METTKKQTVEMTAEELAAFKSFQVEQKKKEEKERQKENRELYKQLVDAEIEKAIPVLLAISESLKTGKSSVLSNFNTVLDMKSEVMRLTKDDQRSHTFTHSNGKQRITLGTYVTDGYRDTVEDGIAIVKEYLESLATDDKTRALVKTIFRLLSRDAQGALKASRVLQLRKLAEESKDERFIEGVQIIEESYQPAISKQFVRAEVKNENGAWVAVPLGMTEA